MNITVANFLGCRKAALDLEPGQFTLVAGKNFAGKSSLHTALSILLTAKDVPDGVLKTELDKLITDGTKAAVLTLNKKRLVYQFGKGVLHEADFKQIISPYAAGTKKLPSLDFKERSADMLKILQAEAGTEQFITAIKDNLEHVDQAYLKETSDRLTEIGWDGAYATVKEEGVYWKRKYMETTGSQYGKAKAGDYIPPDFDLLNDGDTEETLAIVVQNCAENLEKALKNEGASEAKLESLAKIVATEPSLIAEQEEITREVAELAGSVATAKALLDNLQLSYVEEETQPCPHCDALIAIKGGKLMKASVKKKTNKVSKEDIATQKKKLGDFQEKLNAASIRLQAAKSGVVYADKARQELFDLQAKKAHNTGLSVIDCRHEADKAQRALKAFQKKALVVKLHDSLVQNVAYQAALAPEGVRCRYLNDKLTNFNLKLESIAEKVNWQAPRIHTEKLNVLYGERLYKFCSASEKFRCDVILQIAIAQECNDPYILIDAADILEVPARGELFPTEYLSFQDYADSLYYRGK